MKKILLLISTVIFVLTNDSKAFFPTNPPPDHVVIVFEENHAYGQIIGSSSAPYINSLTNSGCLFTNSYGVTHPSQPNYIAFFCGSTNGVYDDSCVSARNVPNLGKSLLNSSLTFKGFCQTLPSNGSTVCTSGSSSLGTLYGRKHNPASLFQGSGTYQLPSTCNLTMQSFPTNVNDAGFANLPTVSIVIPDMDHDMHNHYSTDSATIKAGDDWLKQNINNYVVWAKTHNSLLIITFDEDDKSHGNGIPTLFVGPMVQAKTRYGSKINHYNVLRTVEDMYQLTPSGSASSSAPISGIWQDSVTPNAAPKANAGLDQTITLPANSVNLTGSGSDSDGSISSYAWTQVSGPAGDTIVTPASATTSVSGLVQGTYVFRLTVTDNGGAKGSDDVQVIVRANSPPSANAGADQTITLPINSVTLTGSGTDSDGTISTYAWTQVSGPTGDTIASPSAAKTTVNGLVQGSYTFQLKVTDNGNASATDTVDITVNPAANSVPTANAGPDQTITLPLNTVTLSGSGSDADGSISSYAWTQVSGPTGDTIASPSTATTSVNGLIQGTYVFRLTVKDNGGLSASDDVQITVNNSRNFLIDFGSSAHSSTTTTDGKTWNNLTLGRTGDSLSNLVDTTSMSSGIGLSVVDGFYQVTAGQANNDGTTSSSLYPASATMDSFFIGTLNKVTDNSAKIQLTGLSTNSVTSYRIKLYASRKSTDTTTDRTTIYTINGVSKELQALNNVNEYVEFNRISAPNGTIDIDIAMKSGATYGYLGVVDITESMDSANAAPTANAGFDQTIILPANSVSLSGSGTDSDGSITSYSWTQISGPTGDTIVSPASATTTVNGLVQGTYVFRLTVTDNGGLSASDDVQITVNNIRNFLIDFGSSAHSSTTTTDGKTWNNLTLGRTGDSISSLADTSSMSSGIGLSVVDGFYQVTAGQANNDGTTSSSLYPASATMDSFFIGTLNNVTDNLAKIRLTGLSTNNGASYKIRLYASRKSTDTTTDRTTLYTINGVSKELQALNNVNEYVEFDQISAPNGTIDINIAIKSGAAYGYLGVVDVTESMH